MKIVTGRVVDGKVVVEGEPLDEGSTVTVVAPEGSEAFELDAQDEAALLDAIRDADRGDFVDGETVLRNLRRR